MGEAPTAARTIARPDWGAARSLLLIGARRGALDGSPVSGAYLGLSPATDAWSKMQFYFRCRGDTRSLPAQEVADERTKFVVHRVAVIGR